MQENCSEDWLREKLACLNAKRVIRPGTLRSTLPILGPVITWVRHLWNDMAGRWYVDPAIEQTNAFNEEVVRAFEDIASLCVALSRRVEEETAHLGQVEEQVEQWRARVEEIPRRLHALHGQGEVLSALSAGPSRVGCPLEPSTDE